MKVTFALEVDDLACAILNGLAMPLVGPGDAQLNMRILDQLATAAARGLSSFSVFGLRSLAFGLRPSVFGLRTRS